MTEQEYIGMLQNNTAAANAFNAAQSQKQMDFQVAQNAKAMEFNSRQAELNRNWQEMMSNTAHQREVKDLIAAGLNPVLSAMGGSGASVGAGSAASVAGTQGSKAEADTSLNAGLAGLISTMISGQTQRDVANINAAASMHNAELSADATKYAANSSYAGLMQQLAHMESFPTTLFGTISSLIQGSDLSTSLTGLIEKFTPEAIVEAIKNAFDFDPQNGIFGSPTEAGSSSQSGKSNNDNETFLDKTNEIGKKIIQQIKERIKNQTTKPDRSFSRYFKVN